MLEKLLDVFFRRSYRLNGAKTFSLKCQKVKKLPKEETHFWSMYPFYTPLFLTPPPPPPPPCNSKNVKFLSSVNSGGLYVKMNK